ncbi:type II secretion system protein [Marinobacter sp. NFXS9]
MARFSGGFTLLELMVVLLILALGAAVATPSLMRLADRLGERNERDALSQYLQDLPVAVMKAGEHFTLDATDGYVVLPRAFHGSPVPLPEVDEGYPRVWIPQTIEYRPNGACTGGNIHWELGEGRRFSQILSAPVCRPQVQG